MNNDNNQNKNGEIDFKNWQDAPANSGMKAPEDYFDNFEASILSKVANDELVQENNPSFDNTTEDKKVIPIQTKSNLRKIIAYSSVAAAILIAVLLINKQKSNKNTNDIVENSAPTEWTNEIEIDDYFLAENYTSEELSSVDLDVESSISEDEALDYLMDEEIPDYLLYEYY